MRRLLSPGAFRVAIAGGCLATLLAADALAQQHMQKALDHLEAAQKELDQAEAGKGGHRAKAKEYLEKTIAEVRQGIEYAKERKED